VGIVGRELLTISFGAGIADIDLAARGALSYQLELNGDDPAATVRLSTTDGVNARLEGEFLTACPGAESPTWIRLPVGLPRLQLVNLTAGNTRAWLTLFDDPIDHVAGYAPLWRASQVVPALGTLASGQLSAGRLPLLGALFSADQPFHVNAFLGLNTSTQWALPNVANVPSPGGGTGIIQPFVGILSDAEFNLVNDSGALPANVECLVAALGAT
jgi:hypothetical protein